MNSLTRRTLHLATKRHTTTITRRAFSASTQLYARRRAINTVKNRFLKQTRLFRSPFRRNTFLFLINNNVTTNIGYSICSSTTSLYC
jgi:hypothetical protein